MEEDWGEFRRVLRKRHQPVFDRLFAYAREHADAASHLNHPDQLAPVLVSIDLEQEDRIDDLEARIEEVEDQLAMDDDEPPDTTSTSTTDKQ